MKLKRKITKTEYEALSEVEKKLYISDNDDYVLDIDDTAFENLKNEKKEIQEKLAKYEAEEEERIRRAEERAEKKAREEYEKAKGDKDVEAIEKSWGDKYSKLETEFNELKVKHSDYITKSLLDEVVNKMSNEISTSPTLIAPHIRSRLSVDFTGDTPKVVVLDDKGQRSALTIDELQKSFIDNKDFGAIIKAHTANGGANSSKFTTNGGANGQVKLSDMSDEELAVHYGSANA